LREALIHAITEREGEEDMEVEKDTEMADPAAGAEPQATEVVPTMYRWISSARTSRTENEGVVRSMTLTFSVPVGTVGKVSGEDAMPVDRTEKAPALLCDVNGCTQVRKYKLVKDGRRGACGMSHLKLLA
jgi:Ino eighty subunit 2